MKKKYLTTLLLSILVVGLLFVFLVYNNKSVSKTYYIAYTDPADNATAVIMDPTLVVSFVGKPPKVSALSVLLDPATKFTTSTDGSFLEVKPSDGLMRNTSYKLSLTLKTGDFILPDGKTRSNKVIINFQTGEQSGANLEEKEIFSGDPIQDLNAQLPYSTEHYVINPPNDKGEYVVQLNIPINSSVNIPQSVQDKELVARVSQYKKESLDWIASFKVDLSKITTRFEF